MSKRFTDTEKWNDEWFRMLQPVYKCLWNYLCDRCDIAGVWKVDKGLAEFQIGGKIDWENAFKLFGKRCFPVKEDRILITGFIDFQYGKLNETSRPHQAVLRILELNSITYPIDTLSIPYTYPIDRVLDKDKDKDKDKSPVVVFEIPDHLKDVWPKYIEMRKKIKKPMTDNAQKLGVSELNKLSSDNLIQVQIVEQSIFNSWQGLFPLKEKIQQNIFSQNKKQKDEYKQDITFIPEL